MYEYIIQTNKEEGRDKVNDWSSDKMLIVISATLGFIFYIFVYQIKEFFEV